MRFLREYYKATNRKYADHFSWGPRSKNYKKAWQKGQLAVSKLERRILIIFQYLCLIGLIAVSVIVPEIWFCALIGLFIFVLDAMTTKFSLAWIFILFLIFKRNTVYSKALYSSLFEDIDLSVLTKMTKKYISGYACIGKRCLKIKYRAVSKDKKEISLIFKPSRVILIIDKKRLEFTEKYNGQNELLCHIGNELIAEIEK